MIRILLALLLVAMTAMGASADYRRAAERRRLLSLLAKARRSAAKLPALTALLPKGFFEDIERRIRAEVDGRHSIKLPVAFFLLVRRPTDALARLDAILNRLQARQRKALNDLISRLLHPENHRQAAPALFEVDVLTILLENPGLGGVPYPAIPVTGKKAEASIDVGGRLVYVEATVLSQTGDQERLQDLTLTSAYRPLTPDEQQETRALGSTIQSGVAVGTGRPYNDAYRVIVKLEEKRAQLAAGAPNVICLGIADQDPDDLPVEWAIQALFSGSTTVLQILVEQIKRRLDRNEGSDARDVEAGRGLLTGVGALRARWTAEPRLSAIAVYRWTGHRFDPHRIYRSLRPGPAEAVDAEQWSTLRAALGFGGDQERFLQ